MSTYGSVLERARGATTGIAPQLTSQLSSQLQVWTGNPEVRTQFAGILADELGVPMEGEGLAQVVYLRNHLERRGLTLEDMLGWANECDPRLAPVGWDAPGCFREKARVALREPPSAAVVAAATGLAAFALVFAAGLLIRRR